MRGRQERRAREGRRKKGGEKVYQNAEGRVFGKGRRKARGEGGGGKIYQNLEEILFSKGWEVENWRKEERTMNGKERFSKTRKKERLIEIGKWEKGKGRKQIGR